ncbi:MAG: hypothetical protein JO076_07395 [Verrucomicrobia bacterium]|nr:hypothetical protein [Verrucomicrobiota bacterium]
MAESKKINKLSMDNIGNFNSSSQTNLPAVTGASSAGNGVHGVTSSNKDSAVFGEHTGQGVGVFGNGAGGGVIGQSASGPGVHGVTSSNKDSAVFAEHTGQGIGVFGSGAGGGVVGQSGSGPGVHGKTSSDKDSAVFAEHTGQGIGVFGSGAGAGVIGQSTSGPGVHGKTSSDKDSAVFGEHTGQGIGVFGTSAKGFAGFFQGNVGVSGDILLTGGQDCAERFDVLDAKKCDPGSVMTIDDSGALVRCHSKYDRRVVGVISGAGNLRPGIIFDSTGTEGRVPIALLGTVFSKAVADDASIAVGDLLTTSDVPGHAMKAADPSRAVGAIIGKALEPLPSGIGLIRILIALQ